MGAPHDWDTATGTGLAGAYLTAFDAWLDAGADRNDTAILDLVNVIADEIRASIPPRTSLRETAKRHDPAIAALLAVLRD